MKTKNLLLALLLISATISLNAQQETKPGIFHYKGKNKEHSIGLYAGLSATYTEMMNRGAAWAGAKVGVVFDTRYTVGVAAYGLWYDYRLNTLTTDGTYHMEAGYTGAFFEYMQPFGNRFRLSFSLLLGQGVAKYVYDSDYREVKPWYMQTIDQDDFSVTEPGIEAMFRVAPKWWIGVNGSYRMTSPVHLDETSENVLNTLNGGVSVRFGLF